MTNTSTDQGRMPDASQPLCVFCVKWGDKFSAEYVIRLHAMVQRHLSHPFTFVCLTDNPDGLTDEIQVREIPVRGLEYAWNKLALFAITDLPGTGLYFDLDVIIVGSIDELVEYGADEPFVGIREWRPHRAFPHECNTSVFRFRIGGLQPVVHAFLEAERSGRLEKLKKWDAYAKATVKTLYRAEDGTTYREQQWTSTRLSEMLSITTFPSQWCPSYRFHCRRGLPPGCKVVVFHGFPKPHELVQERPSFRQRLSGVKSRRAAERMPHIMRLWSSWTGARDRG